METTAITPGALDPRRDTPHGFEGLTGSDFLELLVAQLSYQDPLEPTTNEEIVSQISSIRDIEASTTLTRTLETLAAGQSFGSAAGLIGQFVSGSTSPEGGPSAAVSGTVVGLRVDADGHLVLMLGAGDEIPLSAVEHVTTAAQFAEALKDRLVSGLDRSDPQQPSPVEGIVTGVVTDATGQVVLELDNGMTLRLVDVSSAGALGGQDTQSGVGA